jgi:glutathione S-transferase
VRVALAEKGVEVEMVEIHPGRRPARLRELNPTNRIPVLEVGDVAIRESTAICEWIDATYPEPSLWPADATQRAWAMGWTRWIDETLTANFFLGMLKQARGLDESDPPDIVDRMHGELPKRYPTLEARLGDHDGPWLCGEQFTFADVAGMSLAVRLPQWKAALAPDAAATPRVAAWFDALRERPSAAAVERKGTPAPEG